MLTRQMKKLGLTVPVLGYGGMRFPVKEDKRVDFDKAEELLDYAWQHGVRYFDTAYGYHNGESELVFKQALKKYPREEFFLTDKFPVWFAKEKADVEKIFEDQLKKCGVEYFDFYLLHSLDRDKMQKIEAYDAVNFFIQKKKEGKIRHLGFSFHDTPEFLQGMREKYHCWDVVQMQLNYMDWSYQRAEESYKLLEQADIPVLVMEPLRGGLLTRLPEDVVAPFANEQGDSPPKWAMRWVASHKNVAVILSGMTELAHLQENLDIFEHFEPLQPQDYARFDKVLQNIKALGAIPCTGCDYCNKCPMDIYISEIFAVYNDYKLNNNKMTPLIRYQKGVPDEHKADRCIHCNLCVSVCPQGIDIPTKIAQLHQEFTSYTHDDLISGRVPR